MNERAKAILDFWFIQSSMEDWFKKDAKYDEKIKKLFLEDLKKANWYEERLLKFMEDNKNVLGSKGRA